MGALSPMLRRSLPRTSVADLTRLQREQPAGGAPSRVRGPAGQALDHGEGVPAQGEILGQPLARDG